MEDEAKAEYSIHIGLGYEQLRGLARTFASTRQAENSGGIFRTSQ